MFSKKKDNKSPSFGNLMNTMIGEVTTHIAGKGPVKTKDYKTGEEWIIERTGGKIVIHSHKGPGRLHRSREKEVPMDIRLFEALLKWGTEEAKTSKNQKDVDPEEFSSRVVEILTEDIQGKGLYKIKDHETGEEWTIERKDDKILIHSHKEPGRMHRSRVGKISLESRMSKAITSWGKEQL